jgi:hypothetical protein
MAPASTDHEIDLREYVAEISRELTERIEHQREVLLKFVDESSRQGRSIDYCPLINCQSKQRLREGLREAIQVIEETRRSFKSARLERLRLKLEKLLDDRPA